MRQPPYHLRPNKAVDRLLLIEAIRHLGKSTELDQYTYYGLGGPYLEDFRLLHESFPELGLVSIEGNRQIFKRQEFHVPCGKIQLQNTDFSSFLRQYDSRDRKSIFWLDYTGLGYSQFDDFMSLLEKVAAGSIVKVTLRAQPCDYFQQERLDDFKRMFEVFLPNSSGVLPRSREDFAKLVQDMLQIAAQRALPGGCGMAYQPLSSFYYKDRTGIFTLTGIVCERANLRNVRASFSNWQYVSLNWARPKQIDVPFLSTKERLHLQKHLPCRLDSGESLVRALGYYVDDNRRKSIKKMRQYAHFYRHFPYFMKAIP